ncbi:polysaccharide pyruvyl transferase family protein [Staphylococcus xylosus]|uniref:polysaccharide pyruvyl transferase family protein n=1 Tax=Staphylococcus xylosus TaxID=1288 RepID=UPI001CDB6CAF|nr:polysaccharide pyruvyl transferase family protein [Staphylococcus xylosus]MEB8096979.1 polysaccharide pyruvyl transferase family protein [Staphylococcus xylosus]UBV40153.1 polysaccharide pyruvyl transferase family protein [Staphylococcus xylosus]
MKIFFKGYYGFNNIGDDVFVHTIDWFCKKYNFEYLVHGYNLPNRINGKNIKNKFNKLFFDIYYSIKSKQIIYWGGSTFEKISSKRDLKFYLNKISFLNKKVLAMGISIGPFDTSENKNNIVSFIDKMKFVGVRDRESTRYSANTNFTFDLAIITPLVFRNIQINKNTDKDKYTVSLNISGASNFKEYTTIYKNFLKENKKKIKELNILVFNKNDYNSSKNIYNEISKEITQVNFIEYTSDTEIIIEKIANSHLLLGNRLHSAIIAYSYDVPFILNEYHNKCTDFLETIEAKYTIENLAINTSESIENVIEMSNERVNPDEYRELLLEKMDKLAKVINDEIL